MSKVSAVVLSASSYRRKWPGLVVQEEVSTFKSTTDACNARFDAVLRVRTPFFFYLDDDDDLPDDYLDVIEECLDTGSDITYTDELVMTEMNAPVGSVLGKGRYSREGHYRNPTMLHHLVLCDTRAAQEAVRGLPRGGYWPEFLLYWELARRGAAYVPRVGYVWNRGPGGLHSLPSTSIAQARSKLHVRDEYMNRRAT